MSYTSEYAQDSLSKHGGDKKKKAGASNSGASGSGVSGSGNKGQAPARKLKRYEKGDYGKGNIKGAVKQFGLGKLAKYAKK